MARLDTFLRIVTEQQASDLHFHSGNVPVIRHDGDLVDLPFRSLSEQETSRFIHEILNEEQKARLAALRQLDFMYVLPGVGRFRANVFAQSHGLGAVFRVIPDRPPTLEALGLPAVVERLTQLTSGLVIVTGPTGSGKTTTLAALVHEINRSSERHVITIEDPLEYVHAPIKSVVTQRQVGEHVQSFAAGLRSALRETPDVLVVGEMRDRDTVQLALSAAETGVLVLGTLHTNSAARAVDRIVDAVAEETREQARGVLSVLLRAVIAQRLIKRADGDGRVAAVEVLVQTTAVSTLIREAKIHQLAAHLQSAASDGSGSQSLDQCLLTYVQDGLVGQEEALRAADYPEQLRRAIELLPEER
jgi:twitching motility protein PilT